jgi:integrase
MSNTRVVFRNSPESEDADVEQAPRPVGPPPPRRRHARRHRSRDRPRGERFDSTKGYPGEGPGILVSGGRKKASRASKQAVRDVKRGQLAWQKVELQADQCEEAAQRLLVHTVTDDVGLKQYIPAVRKFLDFAEHAKLPCATWEQIDAALLRYLGRQCYVERKHPQQGSLAINGFCYLYPEAVRELPHAWRATKGWSRFAIVKEGQPVPDQTLACMIDFLRSLDDTKATEAADCIALAADGYLREQDLFQLRVLDVILTDDTATLLLGQGDRGESCKSGRDQGVVMDEPNSADILRRLIANKDKDELVFALTADEYRRFWKRAAKEVLGDSNAAGPPHSARHTGASRDLTEGYRTMEQVMKRGRWKALNSVHRYAKSHAWYAALASQPSGVREQGDLLLSARAPRRAYSV